MRNGREPDICRSAIAAALDRVEELRRRCDRPPRVRLLTIYGDGSSGLTIHASISARSPAELRAQLGLGTRCIPWEELDARADELVGLVDAAVGEVTQAIRNVSPGPRPSRSEADVEIETFDALIHELAGAISRAATDVLKRHPTTRVSRELGSEATMLAALKLAALSAYTANVGMDDAQDELRMAVGDVMSKMRSAPDLSPRQNLN